MQPQASSESHPPISPPDKDQLLREVEFQTARSSGPGGQNVNKVNSKVILRLDITKSTTLSVDQKEVLLTKLKSKVSTEGILIVASQEKRSQLENKQFAIAKLMRLVETAFTRRKSRKATKPSKTAVAKRLNRKKIQSEKKELRKKPSA